MPSLFKNTLARRRRIHIKNDDLKNFSNRELNEDKISKIITVLDGGGLDLLKENVKKRFATEVTKGTSLNEQTQITLDSQEHNGWTVKRDAAASLAIGAGLHTLGTTFGFKRINFSRATLFNAESNYSYSVDAGTWQEALKDDRSRAFHDRRMSRLDLLSCGIGSSFLYLSSSVKGFRYTPSDPSNIWICHHPEIYLDNILSDSNNLDIDDATVVVIRVSGVTEEGGISKSNFIAIYGASDAYPNGRMVRYSSDNWSKIPNYGEGGSDYTISGEMMRYPTFDQLANPLTMHVTETNGISQVEYPIITWQMDQTADGTSLFPQSGTMLFDIVFDLDTELSRIVESGGRSARGAWIGTSGNGEGFDKSFSEGETVAKINQDVKLLSHPASNAQAAQAIVMDALKHTAEAYNVPSHGVSTRENFQASSGFALTVLNEPLTRDRERRATINSSSMARKFQIEKAAINFSSTKQLIPYDVSETWEPGEIGRLATPQEERDKLDWLFEKGLMSIVDYYQEFSQIDSPEQAMNMLEKIKNENEQYLKKQTADTPQPAQGLFARRSQ